MAFINQIYSLVNDAAAQVLGKDAPAVENTTGLVDLGSALTDKQLVDHFYHELVNRIYRTRYMVRSKARKDRKVLRDTTEYGAYTQRVYYELPDAVANQTYTIPQLDQGEIDSYNQASPYAINQTVAISSMIFGTKGTWSIEVIRPVEQIKMAFLSASEMAGFIDGIYVTIDNAMKIQEEAVEAAAVNTGIAQAIAAGRGRNVLGEYNVLHSGSPITSVEAANESADFHRYVVREILKTISQLKDMSVKFNAAGYATYTDESNMIVELLNEFASNNAIYLQSDTFHNELVALPNYDTVNFWQSLGDTKFDDTSKIIVQNSGINSGNAVTVNGVIANIRDIEAVAAHFDNIRRYEKFNERSEVMIDMLKADRGYAVDDHMNNVVFYMEIPGTITKDASDAHVTSIATSKPVVDAFQPIQITAVFGSGYTYNAVTVNGDAITPNSDGEYWFTPTEAEDVTIVVTSKSA